MQQDNYTNFYMNLNRIQKTLFIGTLAFVTAYLFWLSFSYASVAWIKIGAKLIAMFS